MFAVCQAQTDQRFKVVVRAETYPEITFKLRETITCELLWPKFKYLKNFTVKKIWSIFKGFDLEIINFQEYKDFPPRNFDKILQILSCTDTERHRIKKLKSHRL